MKRLGFLALLFVPFFVEAQTDAAARAFLDKTITALQQNAVQTDFTVVYDNAVTSESETKQGTLTLKGNKFNFTLDGMELFFDGTTQWMYMSAVDEVSISEPTGKELNDVNPIFMVKAFRKTHTIQFDADDDAKAQNRLLNLYPVDKTADHFRVVLVVKNATKQIVSIKISFKNGTSTLFTTRNYKVLKSLDESAFTFDTAKHPDVMVNDLR